MCYNSYGDSMERKIDDYENDNNYYEIKDESVSENEIDSNNPYSYIENENDSSDNSNHSKENNKVMIPAIIITMGIFQLAGFVLIIIGISHGVFSNTILLVAGIIVIALLIAITIAEVNEIKKIKERYENEESDSNNNE